MSFVISDDILRAARMTPEELRRELAAYLFKYKKVSLEWAAKLSEMDPLSFQHLLASRRIPCRYDVEGLAENLRALSKLHDEQAAHEKPDAPAA
ncbi:MAG: UPF0175 family protein [Candidatus Sumerlaeota bacterium]|nr:UPF0175 family protein [Candidatus Sumerlaeota bacterium]